MGLIFSLNVLSFQRPHPWTTTPALSLEATQELFQNNFTSASLTNLKLLVDIAISLLQRRQKAGKRGANSNFWVRISSGGWGSMWMRWGSESSVRPSKPRDILEVPEKFEQTSLCSLWPLKKTAIGETSPWQIESLVMGLQSAKQKASNPKRKQKAQEPEKVESCKRVTWKGRFRFERFDRTLSVVLTTLSRGFYRTFSVAKKWVFDRTFWVSQNLLRGSIESFGLRGSIGRFWRGHRFQGTASKPPPAASLVIRFIGGPLGHQGCFSKCTFETSNCWMFKCKSPTLILSKHSSVSLAKIS